MTLFNILLSVYLFGLAACVAYGYGYRSAARNDILRKFDMYKAEMKTGAQIILAAPIWPILLPLLLAREIVSIVREACGK